MIKEELRIQMAITRSLMFLDDRTKYIRKPYKFSMQKNLYDAYSELLKLCICANASKTKKTYQHKMDVQLNIIRSVLNVAVDPKLKFISPGLHRVWIREINEIGCMLGAWIKSTQ